MELIVNGENKSYAAPLNVLGLIKKYGLKKEGVAVEVNKSIVKKSEYENLSLKDGDKVEIVHFVGGG